MRRYSKHSDYELSTIFDKRSCLTLSSQIELRDEYKIRNGEEEIVVLDTIIDSKIEEIKNFKHLKDLGFRVTIEENTIQLFRTTMAKIWDVVSIVVGLLLLFVGVIGLGSIIAEFNNDDELNLLMVGLNIFMVLLGITGLKMLSGFNRLIDYLNFKLIAYPNEIILHKLSANLKTEVREDKSSDLQITNDSEVLVMRFGNEIIMKADANNFTQKMTIIELLERIKSL